MSQKKRNNKRLPHANDFSWLAEFEIGFLKKMILSLEISLRKEEERIKVMIEEATPEQYDTEYDYYSHTDSLNDEIAQLYEVKSISKKLTIVGLYMIVESFTKKIMKWLYDGLDEKTLEKNLRELHNWKILKKELQKLCELNLSKVSKYSIINELRCINNVIKHRGYVDRELAEFSNWKDDFEQEIDDKKIDLEKFYKSIPEYIHDLVEKIRESFS